MADDSGYHNRHPVLAQKIRSLLCSLSPSTYDEVAPKIEYWIEYVITEQLTTADDLVERVSSVAWGGGNSIPRFLKEFRDAPHRSERMISFVDQLCLHVLRWFAVASAESLRATWYGSVLGSGGYGFIGAASFVGYLIKCGLLGHDLVRRHLIKPLIAHHYSDQDGAEKAIRATAIYRLFIAAGNTLLQGLLEPKDVRVCFETLDTQISLGGIVGLNGEVFNRARFDELREIHATWLQRRAEGEQRDIAETGEEEGGTAEVPAEIETPAAFVPQDLRNIAAIDIDIPSSILQAITPPSILHDMESSSETFVNVPTGTVSSPTLSISTISDLAPTELGEDIGEGGGERTTTRHETFYFQDGNIEIVCGHTLFRVHSTTISFSSQKLREILSRSALLYAPMPEGCPRITVTDNAEDFAVLLKMIYTPGFPAMHKVPEFTVFASLLRMTTKYGFSDVHDQLVDGIKGAYPTKWEGPVTTKVLGEDVFGSPKPHPNAVLSLFTEQRIKFALPFAAYQAAIGGFSSLISDKPGAVLPRHTLASTIYGMGVIRGGLTQLAHSVVCNISLEECRNRACVVNVGVSPPKRRMEELNKIYNAMVKEGTGDVLSSLSLGDIVCANCAKIPEQAHHLWCTMIWEELPRIFGVGKSWEEV